MVGVDNNATHERIRRNEARPLLSLSDGQGLSLFPRDRGTGSECHIFLDHSAAGLIALDRLEKCLEIAFTKTVMVFSLNELEEDRSD